MNNKYVTEGYSGDVNNDVAVQMAISRFMSRAFGWMAIGLFLSAAASYLVATSDTAVSMIFGNRFVFYAILGGELLLVLGLSGAQHKLSAKAATIGFLAYSILSGLTLSVVFLAYEMSSVSQIFLITSGMFAGLAAYGKATKRDLSPIGAFFGMGVWGLLLVGLANLFFQSEALSLGMSLAGVFIFAGLTAYDTQKLKVMAYYYAGDVEASEKGAVYGALTLYLDFVNLFLSLLRLFGRRK